MQARGGVFDFSAAVAVNDAAFATLILNIAQQLIGRLKFFYQRVANIGAIEAADLDQRVLHMQQVDNVVARGFIGGRSQRHHRQLRETLTQLAQRAILRTEVVSPLRNTVRLVNRQHCRLPVRQALEEVIHHQTLRRDVEQLHPPGSAVRHHLLLLLTRHRGVEARRRHAVGQQLIDLIFHQGNQRRDHQRQSLLHQRRDLIAERFAAAGGHHHQTIPSAQRRINNGLLAGTKMLIAKGILQYLLRQRFLIMYCRDCHCIPVVFWRVRTDRLA